MQRVLGDDKKMRCGLTAPLLADDMLRPPSWSPRSQGDIFRALNVLNGHVDLRRLPGRDTDNLGGRRGGGPTPKRDGSTILLQRSAAALDERDIRSSIITRAARYVYRYAEAIQEFSS